jgi:hypothetical protein
MEKRSDIASPLANSEAYSPKVHEQLVEAGACIRLDDLPNIWHGRAADATQHWAIDPHFKSQGLNAYNHVLYATPNKADAEGFAEYRVKGSTGVSPKVERLVGINGGLMITANVSPNIGMSMVIGVSEGVPVKDDTESLAVQTLNNLSVNDKINKTGVYIDQKELERISAKYKPANIDAQSWSNAVNKYVAAQNSRILIGGGKLIAASDIMLADKDFSVLPYAGEDKAKIVFSKEYIAEVFRRSNIVGVRKDMNSATLHRTLKDTLVIWDKRSVQEKSVYQRRDHEWTAAFAGIEKSVANFSKVPVGKLSEKKAKLRAVIQDLYASPSYVIESANEAGLKDHLAKSVGVWEGYTLGEHTEAALSMFERFYAGMFPASAVPLMRVALFSHDIGKPAAIEKKSSQASYNVAYTQSLLSQLGYEDSDIRLVTELISTGAHRYSNFVRTGNGKEHVIEFTRDYSRLLFGDDGDEHCSAVVQLLDAQYCCDAGAYTDQARFRRGLRVRKAMASLNDVFEVASQGTHHIRRKPRLASPAR